MKTKDKSKAIEFINDLPEDALIEVKKVKQTRSSLQNRALHLFFTKVSDALNELGFAFTYDGLQGFKLEITYTPEVVKQFIWKPIQKAMFQTDSTRQLTTKQIDQILEVIGKFFAEQGMDVHFPTQFDVYLKFEQG